MNIAEWWHHVASNDPHDWDNQTAWWDLLLMMGSLAIFGIVVWLAVTL